MTTTTPINSFGVDQKFKMAISHGQSLHYSFMGNSFKFTLSSIGEALKTMNSIKFVGDVTCQIMHKRCNLVNFKHIVLTKGSDTSFSPIHVKTQNTFWLP